MNIKRYQIFDSLAEDAKPIRAVPWLWLANYLTTFSPALWTMGRIVDTRKGETIREWARARRNP